MCILFWRKKKPHIESTSGVSKTVHLEKKNEPSKLVTHISEEVPIVDSNDEKKVKIQKYHVSQNKDKDAEYFMKWRVRKEGSDKTIQFFDTQKIAIDFAQDLAEKSGSTVVIHKLDGSIRKQDYTKK
ncbi:MAG: DUF2188 domain-containing protein [Firmicutes bacterium]|nr:DUF2188 domain-containing protein [Bacillota bacterium]